jgi:hypothetical protein
MRALTSLVLVMAVAVTGWSFAQQPNEKPKDKPAAVTGPTKITSPAEKSNDKPSAEKKAEKPALDELIAAALRHSPDLQVAEAKVRTAQAELRRDRLTLVQKVIDAQGAVEAARAAIRGPEEVFRMTAQMYKTGTTSAAEFRAAEERLAAVKATLAQAEATLNALTGTLPVGVRAMEAFPIAPNGGAGLSGTISGLTGISGIAGGPNNGIGSIASIGGLGGNSGISGVGITGIGGINGGIAGMNGALCGALGVNVGFGGFQGGIGFVPPARIPQSPMSDKLRAALDAKAKVAPVKEVPLETVIKNYRAAAGVPFLLHLGDKAKEPISMSLEGEVSLGAVFQALEDVVPGLKCYVREYGILVTVEEGSPEAAMPLIEFWRLKMPKPE